VWTRYWKLSVDPFAGSATPYVPVAPHEDAIARLVDVIAGGGRRAVVQAGAGLGKSLILARVLAQTRSPTQRAALCAGPADGGVLFASLAERLGRRAGPGVGVSRAPGWKALEEAVRLCRWQRLRVVLVIDDCHHLTAPTDRLDLDRLTHLDPHPDARVTVLQAYRTELDAEPFAQAAVAPWEPLIRIPALTRSEAETYLNTKLAAAGRSEPTFTPRAISRWHAVATGNPRTLDRFAALALMAGARRGLEIVTPDVVDAVSASVESISMPAVF
jgi:type II secretory pathway predicted ATPase ExeA